MSNIVHLQYGDDDVQGYIERAAAIVGRVELDGDLKVPAFVKAIDLLAGKHLVVEAPAPFALGKPLLPQG